MSGKDCSEHRIPDLPERMITMKNTIKRALVLCLAAAMAAGAFGCGKKDATESVRETISPDDVKTELTFNYKSGNADDAQESESGEDAQESSADSVPAETTVIEEVTEIVNVTDAEGQDVTDAEGAAETQQVVVETREVTVPAAQDSKPDTQNETPYAPAYDTCKAYWLDMSQMGDYDFNGEFLVINFKVNDNTPDGSYPVTISMTDIASWDLVKYDPKIIDGEVAVNKDMVSQEDMPASDFTLKINSVAAKQGDTATVTIDLANNPGFCGFVIDIQYDSNALTIVNAKAGQDFDAAVNVVK